MNEINKGHLQAGKQRQSKRGWQTANRTNRGDTHILARRDRARERSADKEWDEQGALTRWQAETARESSTNSE